MFIFVLMDMDKIKTIDIRNYRESGGGATGSSYFSISDDSVMLKVFNPEYPKEMIIREIDLARKVFEIGVPSPAPGELVMAGERMGISFRRIVGKRSYSRIFADEPERIEEFAREFARYTLKLHSIECPPGLFPDVKDEYLHLLELDKFLNSSEKQVIYDFIRGADDGNNALHGDLQFGNAISTIPFGAPLDTPHEVFFIDLGNFCQGNPLFDLGMLLNICLYSQEEFLFEAFHIHRPEAIRVWEAFIDEYFGGTMTPAQAEDLLRPYQATKMLLVEHLTGYLRPGCERNLRESFGL